MKIFLNERAGSTVQEAIEIEMPLPEELQWLATDQIIESEGCFFFAHFAPGGQTSVRSHFEDETGFECFLNHFHFRVSSPTNALAIAFLIYAKVERLWRESENDGRKIRHIIGIDDHEADYRFHVIRENQSWLAPNLDQYSELIIVFE